LKLYFAVQARDQGEAGEGSVPPAFARRRWWIKPAEKHESAKSSDLGHLRPRRSGSG